VEVFNSWRELMAGVSKLTEAELRESINYEVSTYRRKNFIERMHQRYTKLRSERERKELISGETLL
jgi:hypothetical protein